MFKKVLIANRGEIAVRVSQTLQEMGIAAVAVYSVADRAALHVARADEAYPLEGVTAGETYLRGEKIIDIAGRCGAEAIHPGYGFLSENATFAQMCADAGIVFIGPSPAVIRAMGDKIVAKKTMVEAGVPVVPGWSGGTEDGGKGSAPDSKLEGTPGGKSGDASKSKPGGTRSRKRRDEGRVGKRQDEPADEYEMLRTAAEGVGYPLIVKAAAGGGGKGMRVVQGVEGLQAAVEAAQREAASAFGDGRIFLERYVQRARHVEFQIFGDTHGNTVHLFERECSIQRRHQKIIEESPSPGLTPELRVKMGDAAVRAAQAMGYAGAGTVEFIVDEIGRFYFLEVNTRLQVEHPVTEMVTRRDLVRAQILVAAGERLPWKQDELTQTGHAIECRLYAEDASRGFMPSTGVIDCWDVPHGANVRVDSGVEAGSEVTVHYDPMLAKLIVWGSSREEARQRMAWALRRCAILGVTTNVDFLREVIGHRAFAAGALHTGFLEEHRVDGRGGGDEAEAAMIAAVIAVAAGNGAESSGSAGAVFENGGPWGRAGRWRGV